MTERYRIVIGVNPGYLGVNKVKNVSSAVALAWQRAALEYFKRHGLYVSATVGGVKTVYNTDWGCPVGGEDCAAVNVTRNPAFSKDADGFRNAVLAVTKAVKAALKQTTVTIEETATKETYIK